jgi:sugar-specific transcriptional regulator TrmB
MDEADASEALERLGLTGYEAKMLVGLQKLETATASEIARATDVPRSQVYGTADSLEARGLVEVQNASPTRYRAVPVEEAMDRLTGRFERERDRAMEYLESVRGSLSEGSDDQRSDIWVARGEENITRRIESLVAAADARILLGIGDPAHVPASTVAALQDRAQAGVTIVALSEDDAVLERFSHVEGINAFSVPAEDTIDVETTRMVVVDDRTVLISMRDEGASGRGQETAMWSENTMFASLFARLIEGFFGQYLDAT